MIERFASGRVAAGMAGRAQRKGPTGGWVERARTAVPGDRTRPLPSSKGELSC